MSGILILYRGKRVVGSEGEMGSTKSVAKNNSNKN